MTVLPAGPEPAPRPPAGSRLVTGEAVEVDVRPARLGSRVLALLIDLVVQAAVALVLFLLGVLVLASLASAGAEVFDDALVHALLVLLVVAVFLIFPAVVETVTRGRSPGKRALGLRVVRLDGGPVGLRHAFTRALAGLTLEWPGLILPVLGWTVSLFVMLLAPDGRRLGDLAAGTVVVHERTPMVPDVPPPMPPELARWAAGLDLGAVDDDLAWAIRGLLTRTPWIRPEHAQRLAAGLAAEVAGRVGVPPPPYTPDHRLLAAVLAERRSRAAGQDLPVRGLTQRIWPGYGRAALPGGGPGGGRWQG